MSKGYTRHIDMTDEQVHNLHVWKTVVSRAWTNDEFRQELLTNPNKVLAEHGYQIPHGVQFKIVEDSSGERHLTLPSKPDINLEVSDLGRHADYDPNF